MKLANSGCGSKKTSAVTPGVDYAFARDARMPALTGFKPARYTVHVNGPWCLTFEFADDEARRVDLEQYH